MRLGGSQRADTDRSVFTCTSERSPVNTTGFTVHVIRTVTSLNAPCEFLPCYSPSDGKKELLMGGQG